MRHLENVIEISNRIAENHLAAGESLVPLSAFSPTGVLVNVSRVPFVKVGRVLNPKRDVRKFLWHMSSGGNASIRRANRSCVWTKWLPDEGVSIMGFATMASRPVAERLVQICSEYEFIEVVS